MFTLFSTKNDTLEATEGLKIWKGGGASKLIHPMQYYKQRQLIVAVLAWYFDPNKYRHFKTNVAI